MHSTRRNPSSNRSRPTLHSAEQQHRQLGRPRRIRGLRLRC